MSVQTGKTRNIWGWGWREMALDKSRRDNLRQMVEFQLGQPLPAELPEPELKALELRTPRIEPPDNLRSIFSDDPAERAGHTYGKSFCDLVRGLAGQFDHPPDWVALPRTEDEVVAVLDWAQSEGVALIPFGGGSSVTGGVEARRDGYPATISLDMKHLDRILEVDEVSRAARIQGGVYGPSLEEQLRPSGLTLRHFPQSFEFSSLGGWIATRGGGHYATVRTHIEDFVEALRVITPTGTIQTRRLPASGAGPAPGALFAGSEGGMGIITEAWMRVVPRPRFRHSTSAKFADYNRAVDAVRALAQSTLYPANCRLLDANEAMVSGTAIGKDAILVLGFESAETDTEAQMRAAVELVRDHGGEVPDTALKGRVSGERDAASNSWRQTFLEAPYLRDALVRNGLVVETFETAVTWDKFSEFHAGVLEAARGAMQEVCGGGLVSCRFTHVYPDGVAPYYTVLAPGDPSGEREGIGGRVAQWREIKEAASEAILRHGGTITHHHAVGRDHMQWYAREADPLHVRALAAAKRELDPRGIMNPGVLLADSR